MQDYELDSYLNGTEITDEQRDRLKTALETIEEIYPRKDEDYRENEQSGNGALSIVLGDDTFEDLAKKWSSLREQELDARYQLHGAIIVMVQSGMSESEAARTSGIGRLTVRKLLGK